MGRLRLYRTYAIRTDRARAQPNSLGSSAHYRYRPQTNTQQSSVEQGRAKDFDHRRTRRSRAGRLLFRFQPLGRLGYPTQNEDRNQQWRSAYENTKRQLSFVIANV